MKHLAFKNFLVAILSLTIIMPVAGISAAIASTPLTDYRNPYPPPNTPGAPAGPPRLYLTIAKGKPYWVGFEDFSYYLASGNYLYGLGRRRAEALSRISYPHESLTILNFGCASGDSSVQSYELEGGQYKIISLETVKERVKYFIGGYYYNIGTDPVFLTIAVGINASVTPSAAHGANWANMINALNNWILTNGYDDHVYVVGAIDIETQWNPTPAQIQSWISAYDAATTYRAYNFGNALDCPRDKPPTQPQYQSPVNRLCRSSWWQDNVAHVSGSNYMFPLSEIYHTDDRDSDTWYRIGLYFYFDTGSKMDFHGSLTQYYACEQRRNPVTGELPGDCMIVQGFFCKLV